MSGKAVLDVWVLCQGNGSMLLAVTASEAQALHDRAGPLHDMGVKAVFYDHKAVKQVEPSLVLPAEGGALLVESDAQLVSQKRQLLNAWFSACCNSQHVARTCRVLNRLKVKSWATA